MAYDSTRECVVLFGGTFTDGGSTTTYFDDTWEYVGGQWTKVETSSGPSPRGGHTMAYDLARNRVVLFGGSDDANIHSDTWEYFGTGWAQRQPVTSPSARTSAAMAYDAVRGAVVLFGGRGAGELEYLADTQEFDGERWIRITTAVSPPKRSSHAMVFDSTRNKMVLFGGGYTDSGMNNFYHADTWEYDGTSWIETTPDDSPTMRGAFGMAFDARRGVTVVFGGYFYSTSFFYFADTWEYDGSLWLETTPSPSPPIAHGHAMVFDPRDRTVLLFGGHGREADEFFDHTWTYGYGGPWPDEICDNGADDDEDGLTDCGDPDCDGRACNGGVCSGGVCR